MKKTSTKMKLRATTRSKCQNFDTPRPVWVKTIAAKSDVQWANRPYTDLGNESPPYYTRLSPASEDTFVSSLCYRHLPATFAGSHRWVGIGVAAKSPGHITAQFHMPNHRERLVGIGAAKFTATTYISSERAPLLLPSSELDPCLSDVNCLCNHRREVPCHQFR